jgi:hypothetical protein
LHKGGKGHRHTEQQKNQQNKKRQIQLQGSRCHPQLQGRRSLKVNRKET